MEDLDIGISFQKYQIIRWTLFITMLLFYIFNAEIKGGAIPQNQAFILIGTFILSTPRVSVMDKKTPFIYVLEIVAKKVKKEMNNEVYSAISQLKNICIAKQKNPPGSDFILEQLRKFSKKTRPVWNQTIYLWSMGKREEACHYFSNKIGTTEAEELSNLFIKLDELNPIELKNQLILHQDKIKKQRETDKLQSNENKSYMIYTLVLASAFIIILNFIIVAYYIDSLNLLKYQM